jgi:hypothetical protein
LCGLQDAVPASTHTETDGGTHTETHIEDSITEPGWVRGLVDVWASLEEGIPVEEDWGEQCLNHLRYTIERRALLALN